MNGLKIVELARKQIGIKESPANSNNVGFNTWFYGQPVKDGFNLKGEPDKKAFWPWCGTAVSWIYYFAGYALGNIGYLKGYAGCSTALKHFTSTGQVIPKEKVQAGDIGFVDWDGNGTPDHTFIVEDPKDLARGGDFLTLEGNTSAAGSQSNGGEFMEKTRHYVTGKAQWWFVHPKVLDK